MNKGQSSGLSEKQYIRQWLQTSITDSNEITHKNIVKFLCQCLIAKYNKIKREYDQKLSAPTFEQLLANNEHFFECLKQLSNNVLYFAYSPHNRTKIPSNLIGYYELIKNLIHSEDVIPDRVKIYFQNHFMRLLFMEYNISEIKLNLLRYEGSVMLNLFVKELNQLINMRIKVFQKLFGLQFQEQGQQTMKIFLYNHNIKVNQLMLPSIDDILLCVIYVSFKIKKQKVLFSKICDIYENVFKKDIRQNILQFYNQSYIAEHQDKISYDLMERVKIDRSICKKLMGEKIQEQKSIFDMFG